MQLHKSKQFKFIKNILRSTNQEHIIEINNKWLNTKDPG